MRLRRSIPRGAIAASLMFGSAACAGNEANEPAVAPQTTSVTTTASTANGAESAPNAITPPSASATPTPTSAVSATGVADTSTARTGLTGTNPDTSLSDMQIAEIADTANSGEVEQGRYASLHATDARVKQFAQHMTSAHSAIGRKVTAMLHKEGIVPAVSSQSTQLGADAQQTFASLRTKTGSDFDKAYIDAQVKAHQEVLDTFDNKLIPNAQDAQLKATLLQVRPMVAEHLKEAQEIQKSLGSP